MTMPSHYVDRLYRLRPGAEPGDARRVALAAGEHVVTGQTKTARRALHLAGKAAVNRVAANERQQVLERRQIVGGDDAEVAPQDRQAQQRAADAAQAVDRDPRRIGRWRGASACRRAVLSLLWAHRRRRYQRPNFPWRPAANMRR